MKLWAMIGIFFMIENQTGWASVVEIAHGETDRVSSQQPELGGASVQRQLIEELLKMRDPFVRPNSQVMKRIAKTELERHPLEELQVVGILTGAHERRALFLTPDGKTVVAGEQAKIGNQGGFIRQILPNLVLAREKIVNLLGQEENKDREMVLSVVDSQISVRGLSSVPEVSHDDSNQRDVEVIDSEKERKSTQESILKK